MKKIAGVIVMVLSCWLLVHNGNTQKECSDNPPGYNSDRYFECQDEGEVFLVCIGGMVLGGILFCSRGKKKEKH